MKAGIDVILADEKVQDSLIAVMEYLESILAERRLVCGDNISTVKGNFSKIDNDVTMTAGNQVAATT